MMAARKITAGWTLQTLLGGIVDDVRFDDLPVEGLCIDSREARPGDLFLSCVPDWDLAATHIAQAARRGAVAAVAGAGVGGPTWLSNFPVLETTGMSSVAGDVADRFYGQPSTHMRVIGVTGTNGKTSISHYIAHGLSKMEQGAGCGLMGTLGYGLFGALEPGLLTTPDVLTIHRQLATLREAGAETVVMEVSSHALDQDRVAAVKFDLGVFTNLTRDHLDYHPDMDAYGAAKRKLFTRSGMHNAVINRDDKLGCSLIEEFAAELALYAYGLSDLDSSYVDRKHSITPVCGRVFAAHRYSLALGVSTPSAQADFSAPVLGRFNASNILAAIGTLLACGVSLEKAAEYMSDLPAVPGRMEAFGGEAGQPLVVVDYSHTPDSLHTALEALREQSGATLWCVFGCGGDRDRGKRPEMAAAAARWADEIVITDDNPRTESGDAIVADIREGLPAHLDVTVLRDREQAIRHVIGNATPHDTILIAGKGHEPYQEVAGVRRPFSDAAVVRLVLRELPS